MPSALRNQVLPLTPPASPVTRTSPSPPPQKKQKMSVKETYYLAHSARSKLSKEAAKGDHDLRLLVGHANLLDGLMLDLSNAEREQESWFNQTVQNNKAAEEKPKPKHIQWADTIPEEAEEAVEEEFYSEESDDSDDEEELPSYAQPVSFRRPSPVFPTSNDEDAEMEDDDDDNEDLTLTRTSSHSADSPPALVHEDSESDSEDEMPPSPPAQLDAFSEAQRKQAIATTSYYNSKPKSQSPEQDFLEQGYYLPQRQTAIAAY